MKKKWIKLKEPLTIKDMLQEIDIMYGNKIQFKTTCNRVINATYDYKASFINGGWAGSDDYFRVDNKHDREFLQNKKIIKYYRELKE